MRMILQVKIPNETFNAGVKDGTVGKKIQRILEETKPEATYFTEYGGMRGAIMIIDVADASKIPSFAEPWFLLFNAHCELHAVMSPQELANAGLEALSKKWS